jgi:hypothetical protein
MPNMQPSRALFASPEGRLPLVQKPRRPDWFDGREIRVARRCQEADAPRIIVLSVSGPDGEFHLPLNAGEAASLMFEIGYALEQAAKAGRTPCHA